jgi:hypothetical protein
VLRWVRGFDTHDGEERGRQLHALGAILADPDPQRPQDDGFVRDLNERGAVSQTEEIVKINFIYWVEKQPKSVTILVRTLGRPANETQFEIVCKGDPYEPKVLS